MLRDRYKQFVEVGSLVAYPGRRASSVWISTGHVVEIDEAKCRVRLEGGTNGISQDRLRVRWIRWKPSYIIL